MSVNGKKIIRGAENLQYPQRYEKELRRELLDLWRLYKENAWGYTQIDAVSGEGVGGKVFPLTMLEALVPLHYLGEWGEIRAVQEYVEDNVDPTPNQMIRFRILAKFLSGLEYLQRLTGSREVYDKMVELGDSIYNNMFDPDTDMHYFKLNPATGDVNKDHSSASDLSEGLQSLILLSRITGDTKYRKAVANNRDAYFNNLAGTGLLFHEYDPTTGEGTDTLMQDGLFNGIFQGLVTGYLQTNDAEWLRKAHQMIGEFEDHMLNTEYYGIDQINADTGEVLNNHSSVFGIGELPAWLVRVGRPRLAKKLFTRAVDTLLIDGIPTKRVDYKTKEIVDNLASVRPEIADSAEALYAVTGNYEYLYPVWKAFKTCSEYVRREYGYPQIDPIDKTIQDSTQPVWVLGDSLLSVGYALFSRDPYLQMRKTYRLTYGYPLSTWGYPHKTFP